jgi:hypothetical protein
MLNKLKSGFTNLNKSGKQAVIMASVINIAIMLSFTIFTGNPYFGNIVTLFEIICWIGIAIALMIVGDIKEYDLEKAIKEDDDMRENKENFAMKMSNNLSFFTIGFIGIIGGDFSLFFVYGIFSIFVFGVRNLTHNKRLELEKEENKNE